MQLEQEIGDPHQGRFVTEGKFEMTINGLRRGLATHTKELLHRFGVFSLLIRWGECRCFFENQLTKTQRGYETQCTVQAGELVRTEATAPTRQAPRKDEPASP